MGRREKSRLAKLQKEKEEEKRKRENRLKEFDIILAESVKKRKKKRNQKEEEVLNKQNKQNEIATLDIGEDEKKQSPPKGKKIKLFSTFFAGNEKETAYLNCECSKFLQGILKFMIL